MTDRDGTEFRGPAWLQDVVGEFRAREAMAAPASPSAGELWYAAGESGARRILLLLSTDAEHGIARAALTSTEPEVATDASLAFAADEVGASFAVVVQTDLVMPVWLRQLGPYVGRLPVPVELIQQAADSRHFALELEARRGMPLHGPHDSRVAVRDQELDELWEISGDCVAEIEAWDTERAVVDPRLFREAWTGTRGYGAAVAILDARRRGASLGPWTYLRLRQERHERQGSWTPDHIAAFGRLDNDIQLALADATPPSRSQVEWTPAPLADDPFDRDLVDSAFAEALGGGAMVVDFYTMTSLVPSQRSESRGFVAALGQRQCTVTICA